MNVPWNAGFGLAGEDVVYGDLNGQVKEEYRVGTGQIEVVVFVVLKPGEKLVPFFRGELCGLVNGV